ncbi:uncharacterized protein FIBRA_06473 [Fibroporia radiculosa]|uniref:Uncharacterized protein n=1 Tax=Fibroporia radiculosa TaxID=599839 RepID=J4HZ60_9APHY|nr:uncharacterized protein FIBRA_06473 [Fibroporia radiculosa]CCM04302.1 predicted protein [Fibroporia radiculosa]
MSVALEDQGQDVTVLQDTTNAVHMTKDLAIPDDIAALDKGIADVPLEEAIILNGDAHAEDEAQEPVNEESVSAGEADASHEEPQAVVEEEIVEQEDTPQAEAQDATTHAAADPVVIEEVVEVDASATDASEVDEPSAVAEETPLVEESSQLEVTSADEPLGLEAAESAPDAPTHVESVEPRAVESPEPTETITVEAVVIEEAGVEPQVVAVGTIEPEAESEGLEEDAGSAAPIVVEEFAAEESEIHAEEVIAEAPLALEDDPIEDDAQTPETVAVIVEEVVSDIPTGTVSEDEEEQPTEADIAAIEEEADVTAEPVPTEVVLVEDSAPVEVIVEDSVPAEVIVEESGPVDVIVESEEVPADIPGDDVETVDVSSIAVDIPSTENAVAPEEVFIAESPATGEETVESEVPLEEIAVSSESADVLDELTSVSEPTPSEPEVVVEDSISVEVPADSEAAVEEPVSAEVESEPTTDISAAAMSEAEVVQPPQELSTAAAEAEVGDVEVVPESEISCQVESDATEPPLGVVEDAAEIIPQDTIAEFVESSGEADAETSTVVVDTVEVSEPAESEQIPVPAEEIAIVAAEASEDEEDTTAELHEVVDESMNTTAAAEAEEAAVEETPAEVLIHEEQHVEDAVTADHVVEPEVISAENIVEEIAIAEEETDLAAEEPAVIEEVVAVQSESSPAEEVEAPVPADTETIEHEVPALSEASVTLISEDVEEVSAPLVVAEPSTTDEVSVDLDAEVVKPIQVAGETPVIVVEASQSEDDAVELSEEVNVSENVLPAGETEVERPKSPWTPSYSVTRQGPGVNAEAEDNEIADLEQLPEPSVHASTFVADSPSAAIVTEEEIADGTTVEEDIEETIVPAEEAASSVVQETVDVVDVESIVEPTVADVASEVPAAIAETIEEESPASLDEQEEPITVDDVQAADVSIETPVIVVDVDESETGIEESSAELDISEVSSPSGEAEIERPKSPWTPSYSVTVQGPGTDEVTAEDQDEIAELDQLPPPAEAISAESAIEVIEAPVEEPIEIPIISTEIVDAPEEEPMAASDAAPPQATESDSTQIAVDSIDASKPQSWVRSYSVSSQGASPLPSPKTIAVNDAQLDVVEPIGAPEASSETINVTDETVAEIQEPELEVDAIASTTETVAIIVIEDQDALPQAEEGEVHAPTTESDTADSSKSSWIPSYSVNSQGASPLQGPHPTEDADIEELKDVSLAGASVAEPIDSIVEAPVSASTDIDSNVKVDNEVAEETAQPEIVLTSEAEEIVAEDTQSSLDASAPEVPERPWTPSYSVTNQGKSPFSGPVVLEDEEVNQLDTLPAPVEVTEQPPPVDVIEEIAPEAVPEEEIAQTDNMTVTEECHERPWTPSYSVTVQGPGTSTEAANGDSSEPTGVSNGNGQPQAFPTIENNDVSSQKVVTKPSLLRLAPLDENAPVDISGDSETQTGTTSPTNGRARLESTTSSRFFPGGWFSSTHKLPEGRTSHEYASGEFSKSPTSATESPALEVPTNTPIDGVIDEKKRSKWCIIM